ncbi:MAG: UDP-N-acetylmuramate dehydrogenase [Dehalococcoidia bacterium]|nr:UDP-N-acetylmuramate dehydrogenase [Dehalococcoidia bacterium]
MSRHTSFRIGGPAEVFVRVDSRETLRTAAAIAAEASLDVLYVGGGSNLLVSDAGAGGLVVETWTNRDPFEGVDLAPGGDGTVSLWVFSGVPLPRLATMAARRGLSGMEWAAGIPGTVGGGVVNNAGAHGSSMAEAVSAVSVWTPQGDRELRAGELGYGYRTSRFRTGGFDPSTVVLAARLVFRPDEPAAIEGRIAEYTAYRRATQPSQRSVGSIFKNPPGASAGRLLEEAGMKGTRIGDAEISPKHANFIVNRGHARAAEVLELINLTQQRVLAEFGIRLELEIQPVGKGF